ncbi:MAG: CHAT domain-containing protein [Candidatus Kapabacteria bacterium]|nr:CHAT domain-containing protein [Candidatus Kapabacteria bacterium]
MKILILCFLLALISLRLLADNDTLFQKINSDIEARLFLNAKKSSIELLNSLIQSKAVNDSSLFEAKSLHYQTLLYLEEYDSCFASIDMLLEHAKKLYTDTSEKFAKTLQFKMLLYLINGNIQSFKNIFEQVSLIFEKHHSLASDYTGDNYFYLYFNQMMDVTGYLETLDKSGEIDFYINSFADYIKNKFGDDDWDYAWIMMNWATFDFNLGLYQQALQKNLIAEKIVLRDKYLKLGQQYTPFNNLASNYTSLNQYDKALDYRKKCLSLMIKRPGNAELGHTYLNYGSLYYRLGNFSEALNNFKLADTSLWFIIQIEKNNHEAGYQSPTYLYQYIALNYYFWGSVLLDLNRLDEAEEKLNKAVDLFINMNNHTNSTKLKGCYLKLGILNNLKKDFTKSDYFFKKTLDIDDYLYHNVLLTLSESEKDKYSKLFIDDYDFYYNYILSRTVSNPNIISDALNLRLNTKGILYYSTKKIKDKFSKIKDPDLELKISELKSLSDDIGNAILKNGITDDTSQYFLSLQEQKRVIEKQINSRLNLKNDEVFSSKKDWKQIRDNLKDDEAAVEIVRIRNFGHFIHEINPDVKKYKLSESKATYIAFIVTNNCSDSPHLVVLDDMNNFENTVYQEYSEGINPSFEKLSTMSSDEITKYSKKQMKRTYKALWQPLEDKLKGKKRIFISQDGIFHKINLNQLMDDQGKYILDKYELRNIYSIKELVSCAKATTDGSANKNTSYLIGCPDYDFILHADSVNYTGIINKNQQAIISRSRGLKERWDYLPRTKIEILQINSTLLNKSFKTATALDNQARELNLKKIHSPKILHIATHGYFIDPNLHDSLNIYNRSNNTSIFQASGLVFAGANYFQKILKEKDVVNLSEDGILTAYEAANLDLMGTELVVLSACETGLGTIMNGEGVYGLQRAFQLAGARQIVMSLWNVDDEATQKLMKIFYKEYLITNDATTALKRAQQKLKNNKRYSHPKVWGAFVVVGR